MKIVDAAYMYEWAEYPETFTYRVDIERLKFRSYREVLLKSEEFPDYLNAESSAEKLTTAMNKMAPEIERLQYEQDAELEQIYLLQCRSMGQWLLERRDKISDPLTINNLLHNFMTPCSVRIEANKKRLKFAYFEIQCADETDCELSDEDALPASMFVYAHTLESASTAEEPDDTHDDSEEDVQDEPDAVQDEPDAVQDEPEEAHIDDSLSPDDLPVVDEGEGARIAAVDRIAKKIVSIVAPFRQGAVALSIVEREYTESFGSSVPYAECGFKSLVELIKSVPNRLMLRMNSAAPDNPMVSVALTKAMNDVMFTSQSRAGGQISRVGGTLPLDVRRAQAQRRLRRAIDTIRPSVFTYQEFRLHFENMDKYELQSRHEGLGSLRKSVNMDPIAFMLKFMPDRVNFEMSTDELGYLDDDGVFIKSFTDRLPSGKNIVMRRVGTLHDHHHRHHSVPMPRLDRLPIAEDPAVAQATVNEAMSEEAIDILRRAAEQPPVYPLTSPDPPYSPTQMITLDVIDHEEHERANSTMSMLSEFAECMPEPPPPYDSIKSHMPVARKNKHIVGSDILDNDQGSDRVNQHDERAVDLPPAMTTSNSTPVASGDSSLNAKLYWSASRLNKMLETENPSILTVRKLMEVMAKNRSVFVRKVFTSLTVTDANEHKTNMCAIMKVDEIMRAASALVDR